MIINQQEYQIMKDSIKGDIFSKIFSEFKSWNLSSESFPKIQYVAMRLNAQYNFAKEFFKRGSLYNNQMAIFCLSCIYPEGK